MPVSDHDLAHLQSLGAVAWIVITNGDHVRAAKALAEATSARIAGPAAEQHEFPLACASVHRLAELPGIEAALVGNGWPVFRDGGQRLRELAASVG